jgi:signal peptidase I
MKFYRLEKQNPFKFWAYVAFKGIVISLIITIIIMLISGYKFMIVSSGSMAPTLPVGSLVIVTPCEYEDLQDGDIVTMNAGGIHLTHRIVGKYNPSNPDVVLTPGDPGYEESKYWVTKGDNSDTLDGALTDEIVGKVYDAHAFGWVGTVVRYVRANYVFVVMMLILLIAFVSTLEWLKNKLTPDDIEVYETEDE